MTQISKFKQITWRISLLQNIVHLKRSYVLRFSQKKIVPKLFCADL